MKHASGSKIAPSPDTEQILDSLKQAIAGALEKKRRLGQYAVFWEDGKPVLVGDDAPVIPPGHEEKSA